MEMISQSQWIRSQIRLNAQHLAPFMLAFVPRTHRCMHSRTAAPTHSTQCMNWPLTRHLFYSVSCLSAVARPCTLPAQTPFILSRALTFPPTTKLYSTRPVVWRIAVRGCPGPAAAARHAQPAGMCAHTCFAQVPIFRIDVFSLFWVGCGAAEIDERVAIRPTLSVACFAPVSGARFVCARHSAPRSP